MSSSYGTKDFLSRLAVITAISYFALGSAVEPNNLMEHAKVGLVGTVGAWGADKFVTPNLPMMG